MSVMPSLKSFSRTSTLHGVSLSFSLTQFLNVFFCTSIQPLSASWAPPPPFPPSAIPDNCYIQPEISLVNPSHVYSDLTVVRLLVLRYYQQRCKHTYVLNFALRPSTKQRRLALRKTSTVKSGSQWRAHYMGMSAVMPCTMECQYHIPFAKVPHLRYQGGHLQFDRI